MLFAAALHLATAAAARTTAAGTSTATAASLFLCQCSILCSFIRRSTAAAAASIYVGIGNILDRAGVAITAGAFAITASTAAATIGSAAVFASNGTNASSLATTTAFLVWGEESIGSISGCSTTATAFAFAINRFGIHEAKKHNTDNRNDDTDREDPKGGNKYKSKQNHEEDGVNALQTL